MDLTFFEKFADENFVVCFSVVKELKAVVTGCCCCLLCLLYDVVYIFYMGTEQRITFDIL